jgi:large subunit ribosomal protein L34
MRRPAVQVVDLIGVFCCNRGFPGITFTHENPGVELLARSCCAELNELSYSACDGLDVCCACSGLQARQAPGIPLTPVRTSPEPAMKRTYQPSKIRRARTHGFLVRMKSRGGRAVINARRAKGRKRLAV